MAIIRTFHDKENPYTTLNNQALFDPNLSNAARGLWAQCMARRDDWTFYMSEIRKNTKDGKDALCTQINELIQAGYAARLQVKERKAGKLVFKSVDYIFFESKITPEKKNQFLEHFKKQLDWCEFMEPKDKLVKENEFKKCLSQPAFPAAEVPDTENPQLVNTNSKSTNRENTDLKESKKPIVHNSPSAQSRSSSTDSIPFQRKDFSIFDSTEALEVINMEEQTKQFFRPEIVVRWMNKFGPQIVLETIKFFFHIKATQKKPIPKPEAWMEVAFKKKFTEVDKSSQENKAFAENLKKTYRLGRLKINKRYCQDTETGKDYYYYLPPEVFQRALQQLTE